MHSSDCRSCKDLQKAFPVCFVTFSQSSADIPIVHLQECALILRVPIQPTSSQWGGVVGRAEQKGEGGVIVWWQCPLFKVGLEADLAFLLASSHSVPAGGTGDGEMSELTEDKRSPIRLSLVTTRTSNDIHILQARPLFPRFVKALEPARGNPVV